MPSVGGAKAHYDLVVLGAGPGGYSAAVAAAHRGATVALIERSQLGGTCLHRGCIPAKSMFQSTIMREPFGPATERKLRVIDELHGQVQKLLSHPKITVIHGDGYIASPGTVCVTNGEDTTVTWDRLVIATGSSPFVPPDLAGRPNVMTSDGVVQLREVPRRVVVLGGGYTGSEYGGILAHYGSEVTIVELGARILKTEDADIIGVVTDELSHRGVRILTETHLEDAGLGEPDLLLVGIGRRPDSKGIGLEELGIRMGAKNGILVNTRMETNVDGVYAIGDVIAEEWRLAHVAEKEATIAVRNALGETCEVCYDVIPSTIFTDPMVASVGKREFELERGTYVVGKARHSDNSMAHCCNDTRGFVKVLVGKSEPHRILGAAAVGDHHVDVHEIAMAMECGATVRTVAEMVHFHPSRNEAAKMAAQNAVRKLQSRERRER